MLTFNENGAARLKAVTTRLVHQKAAMVLDDRIITDVVVNEPIVGGVIQISGGNWTLAQAEELAKRISGKEPLPESLED